MKWSVVGGAGAMGAVFASSLVAGGEDVTILDTSRPALLAIRENGLLVTDTTGQQKAFRLNATDDAKDIGTCDVLIFLTKAHHTLAAANNARSLVGDDTVVLSLQNGWGNSDTLATVFAEDQLAMGVTYQGALVTAPGCIQHTFFGETFIGSYLDDSPTPGVSTVVDAMNACGLQVTHSPGVKTEVWKKLVLNAAGLPVAALTRLATGAMGKDPGILDICEAIAREAVMVARAKGFDVDPEERVSYIRNLLGRTVGGKASMLQDVEARRKTEIEVINGAVVREADALGLNVPVNRLMVTLVRGLESSWS